MHTWLPPKLTLKSLVKFPFLTQSAQLPVLNRLNVANWSSPDNDYTPRCLISVETLASLSTYYTLLQRFLSNVPFLRIEITLSRGEKFHAPPCSCPLFREMSFSCSIVSGESIKRVHNLPKSQLTAGNSSAVKTLASSEVVRHV